MNTVSYVISTGSSALLYARIVAEINQILQVCHAAVRFEKQQCGRLSREVESEKDAGNKQVAELIKL
jgi:hypothetical protein